jgi:hypothetical protein
MNFYLEKNVNDSIDNLLPVFAQRKFLSCFAQDFIYIVMEENGEIKAIAAVAIKKRIFFKWAIFTSGIISLNGKMPLEIQQNFLNHSIILLKEYKCDFIGQPYNSVLFECIPTSAKVKSCQFGSYQIDLAISEDLLFKNMHHKWRQAVTRAQRDNMKICEGIAYLKQISELIQETMGRSSLFSYSYSDFASFKQSMGENLKCYAVFAQDKIQACVIIAYGPERSYTWFGGTILNEQKGATKYLYWKTISEMKSLGVKFYDFMGARLNPPPESKLEGIQNFKKNFGCEMVTGYLWKCEINLVKARLYSLLTRIKSMKYKRNEDIIDQEITPAKSI